MKKTILPLLALLLYFSAFSQNMSVKRHNYTSFSKDIKKITPVLEKKSTPEDKQHPEYGITPFNSYCSHCTELIDKRTINSRYFVDPDTEAKFFIEQSYFPLHYKKSENDIWRTIDFRLKPQDGQPGIYKAVDQMAPTICDLNRKSTSFSLGKSQFEFNHDLTLYFFDEEKAYLKPEKGDYSDYTIGDEGMYVKNLWQGIDMEQTFRAGEIETNYVINHPLNLPISGGYMVMEDHFTLPDGWTIKEASNGNKLENGYFSGDYKIGDGNGTEIVYHRPAYFDAKAVGMTGAYNLKKNGNDCTLQLMVPVKWLNLSSNTYPIYVDPWVSPDSLPTDQVLGDYQSSGQPYFQYQFTDKHLGSCNDTLVVPIPGGTTLVEAYTAIEYELTYNPTCGSPPEPAPFCTFSQVSQQVINNKCGTTSGVFQCNPALPPYTGTCTTDSDLVVGAHPLRINNFNPNYMACLVPQCAMDTLAFTLENQDSTCGDVCGYLCARGHLFSMIIVGYNLFGTMSAVGYPPTQTTVTVCQGQTVNFIASGKYAVPPYHFLWTKDGGNTYDTTYTGAYSVLAVDTTGYSVACYVWDTCGLDVEAGVFNIIVLTSPPTNAGADRYVCEVEGGTVTLGGTPVTPAQDTIVGWSAENATALSWLSDTTSANPSVTVPPGTADTVFYVVSTTNGYCVNTDTVLVYSIPDPVVTIDSAGPTAFCPGQSVELIATATGGGIASYAWSNGSVDSITTATTPGSYNVTVTSLGGCKDTSNSIAVTNIGPPVFHIFPDTTIELGDSVALFADINLLTATIDSFTWSPLVNLSCATCVSPFASPILPQEYRLTVYRGGCFVSDSLLIQVILPTNFYIPNVFTPDRPGENDQFYIFCQSGVKVLSFQVFDRIGEKVHDGTYPWDGSYRGKPAPQGVYVYTFSLSLFGTENSVFRKGSVTLLR